MTAEQRLNLRQSLRAPAEARAWLSARTAQLPHDTAQDALLIASELVTNAVRHGAPDVVLELDVAADRVRIEVRDGGENLPAMPAAQPSTDGPAGRGLLIVAAIASDWGVVRVDGRSGKTVWAELLFGLQSRAAGLGLGTA